MILQIETKINEESAKSPNCCPLCGGGLVEVWIGEYQYNSLNDGKYSLKRCENCGLLYAK